MKEISELTARNLRLDELAELLREHPDIAVRVFVLRIIEDRLLEDDDE